MLWRPIPTEHVRTLKRRLDYLRNLVDKEQANSFDMGEIAAIQAVTSYAGNIKSRHIKTLNRRLMYLEDLLHEDKANGYDLNEIKALRAVIAVIEFNKSENESMVS